LRILLTRKIAGCLLFSYTRAFTSLHLPDPLPRAPQEQGKKKKQWTREFIICFCKVF
jgi:hypothetical protein